MALGAVSGVAWEREVVRLAPGDTLLLYSDGVTEAQNTEGALFGEERLLEIARANRGRPARELQEALLGTLDHFTGDAPQSDDITVMVVTNDEW
jgi:sigma-B regulation protein RsbU (phosphoserine phosphatase)